VRARDIELFTELTGDRNPLHYDEAAAERSRFGGLIVQGGVTSGLLNAVVAEDLPGPGSVFLHVDWSFKAPVRPGDEITAEVEVLEAREDKPMTKLRRRSSTRTGPSCWTAPPWSGRSPSRAPRRARRGPETSRSRAAAAPARRAVRPGRRSGPAAG
jgi:hypothetical protein